VALPNLRFVLWFSKKVLRLKTTVAATMEDAVRALQRERRQLTAGEKGIVLVVVKVLLEEGMKFTAAVERAAALTELSRASVFRYAKELRDGDDGRAAEPAPRPGRPPELTEDSMVDVRDVVRRLNAAGEPVTVGAISDHLKLSCHNETLRLFLRTHGFKFGTGTQRHELKESLKNVLFRHSYLDRMLVYLTRDKSPSAVIIFLDESYLNLHHTTPTTWFDSGSPSVSRRSGTKYAPLCGFFSDGTRVCAGVGARLNILGACVYEPNGAARFIGECLRVWDGNKAPSASENASKRVRAAAAAAVASEPALFGGDAVQGNMDQASFFAWFADLCKWIREAYPARQVVVQMDNARAHKERIDPSPSHSSRKEIIAEWLRAHGVAANADSETKADLVKKLVAAVNANTRYRVVEHAQQNGIDVIYVPPYHPELQPIEMVWAAVKNPFLHQRVQTLAVMKTQLYEHFRTRVTDTVLAGAWARFRRNFIDYDATRERDINDALAPKLEVFDDEESE
jgi:transposase